MAPGRGGPRTVATRAMTMTLAARDEPECRQVSDKRLTHALELIGWCISDAVFRRRISIERYGAIVRNKRSALSPRCSGQEVADGFLLAFHSCKLVVCRVPNAQKFSRQCRPSPDRFVIFVPPSVDAVVRWTQGARYVDQDRAPATSSARVDDRARPGHATDLRVVIAGPGSRALIRATRHCGGAERVQLSSHG